jgi:hypothetical protein
MSCASTHARSQPDDTNTRTCTRMHARTKMYTDACTHGNIIRISHAHKTHLRSSLVSVAALLSSRPAATTAKGSPSFPLMSSSVRPPARNYQCVCVCVCNV